MIGLLLALLYLAFVALTGGSLPQATLTAANVLFWWYLGWGAFWLLIGGIGFLCGAMGAVSEGTEKSQNDWGKICGRSFLLVLISPFVSLAYMASASLVYHSAPASAETFAEFDGAKCGIATALWLVSFVVARSLGRVLDKI